MSSTVYRRTMFRDLSSDSSDPAVHRLGDLWVRHRSDGSIGPGQPTWDVFHEGIAAQHANDHRTGGDRYELRSVAVVDTSAREAGSRHDLQCSADRCLHRHHGEPGGYSRIALVEGGPHAWRARDRWARLWSLHRSPTGTWSARWPDDRDLASRPFPQAGSNRGRKHRVGHRMDPRRNGRNRNVGSLHSESDRSSSCSFHTSTASQPWSGGSIRL